MKCWNHHVDTKEKGLVNELSELSDYINELEDSRKIFLPDFREADDFYIFSDYSGNKDQQLISYSILIYRAHQFFYSRWKIRDSNVDISLLSLNFNELIKNFLVII